MKISDRFKVPLVQELMTRKVISFLPGQDLGTVLLTFNQHRISSAPVLEQEDSHDVIGFITEDDLMRELADEVFFPSPAMPTVASAMSHDVVTVRPEMDVFEVEKMFRKKNLRMAPVVDHLGQLVGILSRQEILMGLQQMLEETRHFIKEEKVPLEHSFMDEVKWRLVI